MKPAQFLESRAPAWDRLEVIITKIGRKSVAVLSGRELHELTRLYPAVAVDVARARLLGIDKTTQNRINRLAIAAHGLLYRRRHVRPFKAIWRFLLRDYPQLFRRLWVYTTLATAIFLVSMTSAYVCVTVRPATTHLFFPGAIDLVDDEGLSAQDISERFRRIPGTPMASMIMTNNIQVSFYAFSLGISFGIGTCYVLILNAMMLGGLAAHFANYGLSYPFWSFILPHGVLEIMAIMVAAGAGLRLGLSIAIPGDVTRVASLRKGAAEAVLLVLGTIPMFIISGIIEGFVTPSNLVGSVKIVLGITVAAAYLASLLVMGRSPARRSIPGQ